MGAGPECTPTFGPLSFFFFLHHPVFYAAYVPRAVMAGRLSNVDGVWRVYINIGTRYTCVYVVFNLESRSISSLTVRVALQSS